MSTSFFGYFRDANETQDSISEQDNALNTDNYGHDVHNRESDGALSNLERNVSLSM